MFNFHAYFLALSPEQRDAYAEQVRTERSYIESTLIYATKCPRPPLMARMAQAAGAPLEEFSAFFYQEPKNRPRKPDGRKARRAV